MKSDILIIGAGVAGLSSAGHLSALGYDTMVVERGLFPGGHAGQFSCKATGSCARCNACLLEESVEAAAGVHFMFGADVAGVKVVNGGYTARVRRKPVFLDPDLCAACGLCFDACPEKGLALQASQVAGLGPRYALDAGQCLHFNGSGCRACVDACPNGAIDLKAQPREEMVLVRAVVFAGGYVPFDAAGKPRYGYGRLADVVTALDLDGQLRREGRVVRPSDGSAPSRVAFIQCVGSRDKSLGRDYCSRVCCGYALRMARSIRHRQPDTHVSFFYMDLQNAGRSFGPYLDDVRSEIELLQGVPGEICQSDNGTLLVPHMDPDGGKSVKEFDLVVLSIGLGPPDSPVITDLGLPVNTDGFPEGRPEAGLFVTGAASGPMTIAESRAFGSGTAVQVHRYLGR